MVNYIHMRHGQTAISLILVIAGVIIAVALGIAFIVITFVNSSSGYQAATRAIAAAQSGVNDAVLRLARNKDLASGTYTLPVGADTVAVTLTTGSPAAGEVTVVADAVVLFHEKKLQAIVSVSSNGQVTPIGVQELSL